MISRKIRLILSSLLLCVIPLLAGCWNRLEVNQTVVPSGIGFDLTPDNMIKLTVQLNKPEAGGKDSGGGGEKPYHNLTQEARTAVEASRLFQLYLSRIPIYPHAACILMGEEMAKSGYNRIDDLISRDYRLRLNTPLFVIKGASAEEAFNTESLLEITPALSLPKQIMSQDMATGILSPKNLEDFMYRASQPGIDPILPVAEIKELPEEKKVLALVGMAAFRGDKLVGYFNEEESRGYRWIRLIPAIEGGIVVAPGPQPEDAIVVETIRASSKIKPKFKGNKVIMNIKVRHEGNFFESNYQNPTLNHQEIRQYEKMISKQIEREIRACIKKAQAWGSDVAGFGFAIAHQQPEQWKRYEKNWTEIYPTVELELEVQSKIRRVYLYGDKFETRR